MSEKNSSTLADRRNLEGNRLGEQRSELIKRETVVENLPLCLAMNHLPLMRVYYKL